MILIFDKLRFSSKNLKTTDQSQTEWWQKGDVGMEMFIVSSGAVQVVGGPGDSIVFVTLGQGVCFGEIALLGTGGMNRRTASIKVTFSGIKTAH